jgi:NAD(P)-dependent dehydrogenase (short-subunit alcohol dehydrogenase family)
MPAAVKPAVHRTPASADRSSLSRRRGARVASSRMPPPGPITTPFGFRSTAAEVLADVDLTGRRAVVTGAASGIGLETARALAGADAAVTLAVRSVGDGERAAEEIVATTGNQDVRADHVDLTDPASVHAFADGWEGPLDVLVNNAGVMASPERRTREGWELQFATNHLGHFLLALRLHDALAAADGARVVSVSSSAHLLSPVVFDDVFFDFRPYDPIAAYAQSKTANVLFAVAAGARWAGEGIAVNSLTPGASQTNLQRHVEGRVATPPELRKTPEQAAATSALLAASPVLDGVTGRYFYDCNEATVVDHRPALDDRSESFAELNRAVAPYALDEANAERLWELSGALTDPPA